eukprot:681311-Alexandrium_andersonii.AAC.1
MSHFEAFKKNLITLAGFLSHQHLRELFQETCLVGDLVSYRPLLNKQIHRLIDWRWMSLMELLGSIEE